MKVWMIGMMSAMMPWMKSILYVATGLALIGLFYLLIHLKTLLLGRFEGSDADRDLTNAEQRGSIGILGKSLVWFGLFFIACQIAGYFLGASPSFALFANPAQFDFGYTLVFWQAGLIFVVIGIIYTMLGRRSAAH